MVLALALPNDFPFRELVLVMTFGVIVLSILIQGLSMAPLLRWLKLAASHAEAASSPPFARSVRSSSSPCQRTPCQKDLDKVDRRLP